MSDICLVPSSWPLPSPQHAGRDLYSQSKTSGGFVPTQEDCKDQYPWMLPHLSRIFRLHLQTVVAMPPDRWRLEATCFLRGTVRWKCCCCTIYSYYIFTRRGNHGIISTTKKKSSFFFLILSFFPPVILFKYYCSFILPGNHKALIVYLGKCIKAFVSALWNVLIQTAWAEHWDFICLFICGVMLTLRVRSCLRYWLPFPASGGRAYLL